METILLPINRIVKCCETCKFNEIGDYCGSLYGMCLEGWENWQEQESERRDGGAEIEGQ